MDPLCLLSVTKTLLGILPNIQLHFEASRAVFWSLSGCKPKPPKTPFTSRALRGPLFHMQNIRFGHAQK